MYRAWSARCFVVLSLAFGALMLTACGGLSGATLDQQTYDQVKEGMPEDEVVDILGGGYSIKNLHSLPKDADENDPNVSLEYVWKDGNKTVTVVFRQGHVWGKQKSGF